jgi:hypothetical protein
VGALLPTARPRSPLRVPRLASGVSWSVGPGRGAGADEAGTAGAELDAGGAATAPFVSSRPASVPSAGAGDFPPATRAEVARTAVIRSVESRAERSMKAFRTPPAAAWIQGPTQGCSGSPPRDLRTGRRDAAGRNDTFVRARGFRHAASTCRRASAAGDAHARRRPPATALRRARSAPRHRSTRPAQWVATSRWPRTPPSPPPT